MAIMSVMPPAEEWIDMNSISLSVFMTERVLFWTANSIRRI